MEIPIQVNGKFRAKIVVSPDMSKDEMERITLDNKKVKSEIGNKEIKKVIAVPGCIVNIVVK